MPADADLISRARQLFTFLREFASQRLPRQRTLDQQLWRMSLDSLPSHSSIAVGEVTLSSEASEVGDGASESPLLRVTRPKLTRAPHPPESLRDYLLDGWEDPSRGIEVRAAVNSERGGLTVTEALEADPKRVRELAAWQSEWERWAAAELPARRAMQIYERLYELHGKLELQAEVVELVLGCGRLRWQRAEGLIDHPVLLQRVELSFDAEHSEFRVVDADRSPELYDSLLSGLVEVSTEQLQRVRSELTLGGYHPLAKSATDGFLRRLVAILGPRGEFLDGRPQHAGALDPVLWRDPHLVLRQRQPGFASAFDKILVGLDEGAALPTALSRVLGVELAPPPSTSPGDVGPWGEPADVLLSKPANAEQIEIARVLEQKRAVLVQGPPGTGKSHTIANLIGHLVAKGKRVLVTSHTTKALRVLRGQVVESLRPLCVSVLENDLEGRAHLEESVRGILARLTTSTEARLEREVADLSEARSSLLAEVARLVQCLQTVRAAEYEHIVVAGETFAPFRAAALVSQHAEGNGWIPGPVEPGAPNPLTLDEMRELYASNAELSRDEERELDAGCADPSALPLTADFDALVRAAAFAPVPETTRVWSEQATEDHIAALSSLDRRIGEVLEELDSFAPWQRVLVSEGHTPADGAQLWRDLATLVAASTRRYDASRRMLLEYSIDQEPPGDVTANLRLARALEEHVAGGRSLGVASLLLRREWKAFIRGSRVNGAVPFRAEHFAALGVHFGLQESRARLAQRWSRLAVPAGLPDTAKLPAPIEPTLADYTGQFERLLNWWGQTWQPILRAARDLGLEWELLRATAIAGGAPLPPFQRDVEVLRGPLRSAVAARLGSALRSRALRVLKELWQDLSRFTGERTRAVLEAVLHGDSAGYATAREALIALRRKEEINRRRATLLAKLKPVAPSWAAAIRNRTGEHGAEAPPGDVASAWRWRVLSQELERRRALDEAVLAGQLRQTHDQLRSTTAEVIDRRAWLGQTRRVGLKEQQALNGWAQLQRKIGKGTGKRAPALQAQARARLAEAQGAVPVWIMPLARVAEAVDPTRSRFDVVIIDEASQCDLMGLLAWYLADQIVVVGDDMQVSPMAVGQKLEGVQSLINQHLRDVPNSQLYDGSLSVYDLAQQSFGGTIRLREHFRCMPDIIEFSNELSYDFEIKPLRNPYAAPMPHVVEHVVAGAIRDGKTNPEEARHIAALVATLVERDRDAAQTIGAVSLLGDEQAALIWECTAALVGAEQLERRRFVAGNSAQFQGDERDVMFLSMVDSPREGPLPLRQESYLKQRYNVAASRARDQLWLVHSLDPGRDLKPGDLRRQLIDYVRSPGARGKAAERAVRRAESPFEVDVIRRLTAAGYGVEPQVKVGSYRIDMVVFGGGGRIALECDGARFHPPEQIPADMARQAILERSGWRFVRIRSTLFYADPEATMKVVFEQLAAEGVLPDALRNEPAVPPGNDLVSGIRRRAWELMRAHGWTPEPPALELSIDEAP